MIETLALLLALVADPKEVGPKRCFPIFDFKASVSKHHGIWADLNKDQWQFARGLFAFDPNTPPGLPYGDEAELATMTDGSGVVIFVDNGMACDPMAVIPPIMGLIKGIGKGEITHEGDAL